MRTRPGVRNGPTVTASPVRTSRPARGSTALLVALLVGLSACASGPDLLDVARVQRDVTTRAQRDYPKLTLGRTRCPRSVEKVRGRSFVCTVPVGDGTLRIRVRQRDGAGHVQLEAEEAVITKEAAEFFVAQRSSIPAKIDCGTRSVFVVPPGTRFPCTVSFVDGTMQSVSLRVLDTAGTVAIEVPAKP